MTRQFRTEADIARFVKQGFGQGEGSSYKPWIRVQDVPSIGRSQKVLGTKTQRVYHFLSRLEYHYFLLLEFSSQVVDIREQFPLFATARSRDIAADMGIQYPVFYGTQLPFVFTSDFVITLRGLDGMKRITPAISPESQYAELSSRVDLDEFIQSTIATAKAEAKESKVPMSKAAKVREIRAKRSFERDADRALGLKMAPAAPTASAISNNEPETQSDVSADSHRTVEDYAGKRSAEVISLLSRAGRGRSSK